METYFWGAIDGTGVSVREEQNGRGLQAGALNVTCYLGSIEKGESGEIVQITRQEEIKTQIGERNSDGWSAHMIYDLFKAGSGATHFHIPVRDGSEVKAAITVYAREPRTKPIATVTARSSGRWAGRTQELGALWVTTATDLTNTTVQLDMTAEPLATNGLKKDQLKGGVLSLTGVALKTYEVIGNTTAGLVSVRSGSKMKTDYTASGSSNKGLTILVKENTRKLTLLQSDSEDGDSAFFSWKVFEDGVEIDSWAKLSLDPESTFYFTKVINADRSRQIDVVDLNAPDLVVADYRPASYFGRLKSISARTAEVELFAFEVDAATSGVTDPTVAIGATTDVQQFRDIITATVTTAGVRSQRTLTVAVDGDTFAAADTDTLTVTGAAAYVIRFINGADPDAGAGGDTTITTTGLTAAAVRDLIVTALNAVKATTNIEAVAAAGDTFVVRARYGGTFGDAYEVAQAGTSFTGVGVLTTVAGVNAIFTITSQHYGAQGTCTLTTAAATGTTAMVSPMIPNFTLSADASFMALTETITIHYMPLPVTVSPRGSAFLPNADAIGPQRFRVDSSTHKTVTLLSGNMLLSGIEGTGTLTTGSTGVLFDGTTSELTSEVDVGDFVVALDADGVPIAARKVVAVTADDGADALELASGFGVDLAANSFTVIKRWMLEMPIALEGGYDGIAELVDDDFTALMDPSTSPMKLVRAMQPSLVKFATPGLASRAVIQAAKAMCFSFNWQYRVEIPSTIETSSQLQSWLDEVSAVTDFPCVTTFPSWMYCKDPARAGFELLQPITGMVHGVESLFATRWEGYHKAAAGEGAELVDVIRPPTVGLKLPDNGRLTKMNVNFVEWVNNIATLSGNRCLTTNTQWIDKTHREMFSHYENILLGPGFRPVIFALNNASTYSKIRAMLRTLFEPEWKKGALQGRSFDEACLIKIDDDNNTAATRAAREANVDLDIWPVDTLEKLKIRVNKRGVAELA